MTKEIAEQFKLDSTKGALVTDVSPGSPAERAGIIRGDVIRKVNNYEIRDTAALINRISEADIGSQLTIDLVREGQPKTVTASVVEQPADMMARLSRNQNSKPGGGTSTMFAGVEVQDLSPRLRQEANVPENVNGVIVTAIDPSSSTAQELRPGDVIEEVNRRAVNNLQEFQQIVGQLDVVGIARGRQRSFVIVQPG
jgi:serine protease Do